MKPETEIRNLKRALKEEERERYEWKERSIKWEKLHDERTRELNGALEEIQEWKRRFDMLLSKVELPKMIDEEERT